MKVFGLIFLMVIAFSFLAVYAGDCPCHKDGAKGDCKGHKEGGCQNHKK